MNSSAIIIAILAFSGQTAAALMAAFLAARAAKHAHLERQAGTAFRAAIESRLDALRQVADSTHVIVNNQRTAMLQLIASLRRRIADEHPHDKAAATAAAAAELDAGIAKAAGGMRSERKGKGRGRPHGGQA